MNIDECTAEFARIAAMPEDERRIYQSQSIERVLHLAHGRDADRFANTAWALQTPLDVAVVSVLRELSAH